MGIVEQLENEHNQPPEVFSEVDDKLEEWLGIVPEGSMKRKARKAPAPKGKPVPPPVSPPVPPPVSPPVPPPVSPPVPPPVQDQLTINLQLATKATDIYKPGYFKSGVEYSRALKRHQSKVPKGYHPGFIIIVTLGSVTHTRRIAEPVRSKEEAYRSAEFVLAMTESISAILNHK